MKAGCGGLLQETTIQPREINTCLLGSDVYRSVTVATIEACLRYVPFNNIKLDCIIIPCEKKVDQCHCRFNRSLVTHPYRLCFASIFSSVKPDRSLCFRSETRSCVGYSFVCLMSIICFEQLMQMFHVPFSVPIRYKLHDTRYKDWHLSADAESQWRVTVCRLDWIGNEN